MSVNDVLAKLASGEITQDEAKVLIDAATVVVDNPAKGVSVRVSEKGAVCVYGTGRFPVSLYPSQWDKVIAVLDEIKQNMELARPIADKRKAA